MREIRAEQTLFSLPFVFVGVMAATPHVLTTPTVLVIAVAVAAARALGMLLNRIIDASIDRLNPRTRDRYLASGRLSLSAATALALACGAVYLWAAGWLGDLPLRLSPIPVVMFVVYPYTKRFTYLCHFILGATLGLAPLAGWIAVSDRLAPTPFVLLGAVALWVAGFDILYATMDVEFDRTHGVYSLPARFGFDAARAAAFACHGAAVLLLVLAAGTLGFPAPALASTLVAGFYLFALDAAYAGSLGTPAINDYLQANSYFSVITFLGYLAWFLGW